MVVHQTGAMSLVVCRRDQCWDLSCFLIYDNDIDNGLSSKISEFADDTKIVSKVTTTGDKNKLQNDLDRLVSWA